MNENSFSLKPAVGRPKGAKTGTTAKPQTLAAFVHNALNAPIELKDVPPRPKKKSGNGVWGRFKTPEERQAYARELAAKRKASGKKPAVTRQGVPHGWTREKAEAARALAEIEADEMVAKLKASGAIAKGDIEAAEATKEALVIVRSPGASKTRRQIARRLLSHYHPELKINAAQAV